MMSTPSSRSSAFTPTPPGRPRKRSTPLLVALAVVVVLAVGGGAAAFFANRADAGSSDATGPHRTAAELARKGLNCNQTTPVTDGVAPASERVTCQTGAGSDAVVSVFENAKTARSDADKKWDKFSGKEQEARGFVVGPYWTVSCSLKQVCESAQGYLEGELLS